jgi:hypothetical protein
MADLEQSHAIDNIVLTAINDGDGSQCGATYAQRYALAEHRHGGHILKWRKIADTCADWLERGGSPKAWDAARARAARKLQAYYIDHVREA